EGMKFAAAIQGQATVARSDPQAPLRVFVESIGKFARPAFPAGKVLELPAVETRQSATVSPEPQVTVPIEVHLPDERVGQPVFLRPDPEPVVVHATNAALTPHPEPAARADQQGEQMVAGQAVVLRPGAHAAVGRQMIQAATETGHPQTAAAVRRQGRNVVADQSVVTGELLDLSALHSEHASALRPGPEALGARIEGDGERCVDQPFGRAEIEKLAVTLAMQAISGG